MNFFEEMTTNEFCLVPLYLKAIFEQNLINIIGADFEKKIVLFFLNFVISKFKVMKIHFLFIARIYTHSKLD